MNVILHAGKNIYSRDHLIKTVKENVKEIIKSKM